MRSKGHRPYRTPAGTGDALCVDVDDLFLPGRITDGDFGGWLREAMAERRISQRALAMRSGINHSTISRLLARGRMPSLSTAIAIVRVLQPRSGRR